MGRLMHPLGLIVQQTILCIVFVIGLIPGMALALRSSSPSLDGGDMIVYTHENEQFETNFALPNAFAYPPSEAFDAEVWDKGRWRLWTNVTCKVVWTRAGARMLVVKTTGNYSHGEGRCVVSTRTGADRAFPLYIRWE
jgi:hypothetical protein